MARKLDRQIFRHSSFSEKNSAVDLFLTIITTLINFDPLLNFYRYKLPGSAKPEQKGRAQL
jgi:hypothetical protein